MIEEIRIRDLGVITDATLDAGIRLYCGHR